MSLIITATDFSATADEAVHYACKLAVAYNATITVVHAYNIPVTFAENPMPVMPLEESRQIAETSLDNLVMKLAAIYPGLLVNSHLVFGDITEGITEYAEEKKPWLVIVGNSLSEEDSFWYGTNLLQLMRELPYPVLAIPHGATFAPIKNICLACDYKRVGDHLPVADVLGLVQSTGAALQVLNIDHDNKNFGTETPLEATVAHDILAPANPTFHFIDSADVDEGIQNFLAQNPADWLIVTPHKYNFFEGLFHRSRTKAIARHINIPVLALHER